MHRKTGAATLTVLVLLGALATVAGCGRKNLPVAPRAKAENGVRGGNAPASIANFERSNRVTTGSSSLRIKPAEVSRNPGASRRPFVLDGLLN